MKHWLLASIGVVVLTTSSAAQDRLKTYPGYDRYARLCIVKEVPQFDQGVSGIERHERRTDLEAGHIEGDRFGRFVDLGRYPVADFDTSFQQRLRKARGQIVEIAVAEPASCGRLEKEPARLVRISGMTA